MIQIFDANLIGKDYICADIHGCFDALAAKLHQVGFQPEQDRLFSLGDLINRGEKSASVLHWLEQPWFHPVLGNHEFMFMQSFETLSRDDAPPYPMGPAYHWTAALNHQQLQPYYAAFCKLPLAIELTLPSQKTVALVHAQLPLNCDWLEVKNALQKSNMLYIASLTEELLWSKNQAFGRTAQAIEAVRNLDHVFHGHAILNQVTTHANRTFLDLGSHRTGKIGFLEPEAFLARG